MDDEISKFAVSIYGINFTSTISQLLYIGDAYFLQRTNNKCMVNLSLLMQILCMVEMFGSKDS